MKSVKIFMCLALFFCIACSNSNTKKPFLVLQYDGNKEIELYSSPNIAIVDGESGCWEEGALADMRYEVHYGSKHCAISTTKCMIYFGDIMDAVYDLNHEEKWIPYREKH